jgi:hypothetical protein
MSQRENNESAKTYPEFIHESTNRILLTTGNKPQGINHKELRGRRGTPFGSGKTEARSRKPEAESRKE